MNTAIIIKTLTSRPAKKMYVKAGKCAAKLAAGVVCEVTTYFAAQKIIKGISKKTEFEPVETCTIKVIGA